MVVFRICSATKMLLLHLGTFAKSRNLILANEASINFDPEDAV